MIDMKRHYHKDITPAEIGRVTIMIMAGYAVVATAVYWMIVWLTS